MRSFLLSAAIPLACVSGALLLVAACEDDHNGFGGFDAGAEGSLTPTPTSTSPTPLPDGAVPEAGSRLVTVRVRDRGNQPVASASVLFSNAAGDALGTVQADATGVATFAAPSGAQVTVGFGDELTPRLVTITGVEPGDDLLAADMRPGASGDSRTFRIASLPPDPPAGSQTYARLGDCYENVGAPPTSVAFSPDCSQGATTVPLVVETTDGLVTVGWTAAKNLAPLADGGETPVTLPAWSTSTLAQTVTATNVAGAGGSFYVSFGEIASGVVLRTTEYAGSEGAERSATFLAHPGFGEALQAGALAYDYSVSGSGMGIVGASVRAAAPTADGGVSIDWANQLPGFTSAGIDAGAPSRPYVSWTSGGSLASADGTFVILFWDEPRDAGTAQGSWTILAPPTATSVQTPALPPGFKGAPRTVPSYDDPPRIVTVEASFVPGYAQLRAAATALSPSDGLLNGNTSANAPALPSNGAAVRFTAYTRNND